MKRGINKTDNYFERNSQKSSHKNYRFYFFDYLYFKGEQWYKKAPCTGDAVLCHYWYLIVAIPAFGFTDEVHRLGDYAVIAFYAFLILFPCVFPYIRYRKDRKAALVRHYRHSKSNGVTMAFIIILPFALLFFELWLFDRLGWVDCRFW
ncbi:hypothetical protein [Bacteroides sp.]|uniref:hypothetical protein n=1 Tax=Bacteroides sp. TaxID=29523 RepID=UPI003AB23223